MPLSTETAARLVDQIFELQRVVRCSAASISRREGLNAGLHFVLRLLARGECRAAVLAVRLGIGAPALSRHLAELEALGLVIRRRDPRDGRAQLVSITQEGVERLDHLERQRLAAFQNHLWNWNEEEAASAAEILHELTESLTGRSRRRSAAAGFTPEGATLLAFHKQ